MERMPDRSEEAFRRHYAQHLPQRCMLKRVS